MIVRPFEVVVDAAHLVFAFDPKNAAHRVLVTQYGLRRKYVRLKRMERVETYRVFPWRTEDRYEFAVSGQHPCDAFYALNALNDAQLALLCRMTWSMNDDPTCDLGRYVPVVWGRCRHRGGYTWEDAYTPSGHMQMVYALRTAMEVPIATRHVSYNVERRSHAAEIARFRALHAENIGYSLTDLLLTEIGTLQRHRPEIAELVERFCAAYGYDATQLRWTEIIALWNDGAAGLQEAMVARSLTRYDFYGR